MKLKTERQKTLVVNNIVRATKDITKLNKVGYNFIYLACGFTAHYNMFGFIDYYEYSDLALDIIHNKRINQWNNFNVGDQNYDYYMERKEIYNRICVAIGV